MITLITIIVIIDIVTIVTIITSTRIIEFSNTPGYDMFHDYIYLVK